MILLPIPPASMSESFGKFEKHFIENIEFNNFRAILMNIKISLLKIKYSWSVMKIDAQKKQGERCFMCIFHLQLFSPFLLFHEHEN